MTSKHMSCSREASHAYAGLQAKEASLLKLLRVRPDWVYFFRKPNQQILPNGPAQDSASAVLQIVLTQREGESEDQYRQGIDRSSPSSGARWLVSVLLFAILAYHTKPTSSAAVKKRYRI